MIMVETRDLRLALKLWIQLKYLITHTELTNSSKCNACNSQIIFKEPKTTSQIRKTLFYFNQLLHKNHARMKKKDTSTGKPGKQSYRRACLIKCSHGNLETNTFSTKNVLTN